MGKCASCFISESCKSRNHDDSTLLLPDLVSMFEQLCETFDPILAAKEMKSRTKGRIGCPQYSFIVYNQADALEEKEPGAWKEASSISEIASSVSHLKE